MRRAAAYGCCAVQEAGLLDDGQQTLMRGLATAVPCVRPGLPRSASGHRQGSATQTSRGFPTVALPPAMRNRMSVSFFPPSVTCGAEAPAPDQAALLASPPRP